MCVKCRLGDVARALKCVYVCVCGRGVKCQRAAREEEEEEKPREPSPVSG